MNWIFCCMPLESSSVFLARASAISRRLAQAVARLRASAASGRELAEEDKLVEDLHLLVEAALFGQIADAVEAGALEGLAEETDRPESGMVMPIIMRMELVLPAPLGPSRPNIWPASMERLRSLTATLLS